MNLRIDAIDKKTGMTIADVELACANARAMGLHRVSKAVVGFRGQLRALEFREILTTSDAID
jgi:hypothetical protein